MRNAFCMCVSIDDELSLSVTRFFVPPLVIVDATSDARNSSLFVFIDFFFFFFCRSVRRWLVVDERTSSLLLFLPLLFFLFHFGWMEQSLCHCVSLLTLNTLRIYRALLLMERSLELVDTSAKNEDDDDNDDDDDGSNNGEAPVYSSHFLMDFLPPSKKGQRECLPLLIKVHCTTMHYTTPIDLGSASRPRRTRRRNELTRI